MVPSNTAKHYCKELCNIDITQKLLKNQSANGYNLDPVHKHTYVFTKYISLSYQYSVFKFFFFKIP